MAAYHPYETQATAQAWVHGFVDKNELLGFLSGLHASTLGIHSTRVGLLSALEQLRQPHDITEFATQRVIANPVVVLGIGAVRAFYDSLINARDERIGGAAGVGAGSQSHFALRKNAETAFNTVVSGALDLDQARFDELFRWR